MKYLIGLSLIVLLTTGCTRNEKEYYKTGELRAEFHKDKNGLKQGEVINYYKNGGIKSKGICINDTFNGAFEEYYTNGQLESQTIFVNGIQEGELLVYYSNGKISQRSNYLHGKENGLLTFYYVNGNVSEKAYMKDGFTHYYTTYDSLGSVKDKKHSMEIFIISPLIKMDSIRIKEKIYGFIPDKKTPVFALIEKYGTVKEGDVPKMKFNTADSSYYISFPPQKDVGKYFIKTFFYEENKYKNENDTTITIK